MFDDSNGQLLVLDNDILNIDICSSKSIVDEGFKDGMIKFILIRNPIQPDKKEFYYFEFRPDVKLGKYVDLILSKWPDTEFVVSVNGEVIENDILCYYDLRPMDCVVLNPVIGKGFGDILKSLLMVALMAWAGPAALVWAGGNTVLAAIYTGIVGMVGGAILNAIIPTQQEQYTPSVSETEMTTTYGWNGARPTEVPGTPVGMIFGTVSPALVRLQRHVSTDGNNQYLNLLYSAGSGPVDSIDNIKVDGNKISNFDDVEYWTRLGTNDQDVIANFSDTVTDYNLAFELEAGADWTSYTTEGDGVEGLEIMVQFPSGIYYTNDDGSLGSASVGLEFQYKLVGSATWIVWSAFAVSAATNGTLYRSYKLDKIASGRYDIRVRCTSKSGTTSRYATAVWWTQLSEIIYDDFIYPNKALLGIRIKATDQLSGSDPKITCEVTRSKVWIWNPYTLAYEQKRASNPFWAAYDLVHKCRQMKNINTGLFEFTVRGNPHRKIDYDRFLVCAEYSDNMIDGDYRFILNLFLEGNINMWDALQKISSVGRGCILPRGSKFSAICDMPTTMTQLFTDGNMVDGNVVGEYQGTENRARSVEVTFWNKQKNYEKDMAIFYSDEYESNETISNPTQATYQGITNYKHAYREAAFLAKCNKYKERTKSWQADIDAISCLIGDVVGVQCKVSRWGYGGRIVSATTDTVKLDEVVTLTAGTTYKLYVRMADDEIVEKVVAPVLADIDTDTLTLVVPFTEIPERFDLYAVADSIVLMKILSIVQSGDQKAKITAEQYFSEIYDDNVAVPTISTNGFDVRSLLLNVVEAYPRPTDGTFNLSISWVWPRDSRIAKAFVYVGTSSSDYSLKRTVSLGSLDGIILNTSLSGTVYVRVRVTDIFGSTISDGTKQCFIDPYAFIPTDVTSIWVEQLANGRKRFSWGYVYPEPNDILGFKLKYHLGVSTSWADALPLHDGVVVSSPFETDSIRSGIYTVLIKAVDNLGVESTNPRYAVLGVGDELVENVLMEIDYKANGFSGTKVGCEIIGGELVATDTGEEMYDADEDALMYSSDDDQMYVGSFSNMSYKDSFIVSESCQLLIQASCEGDAIVSTKCTFPDLMWNSPGQPMWSADNTTPMWRENKVWSPYTSKVNVLPNQYDIKIDIAGSGEVQGSVKSLVATLDVKDIVEVAEDIVVPVDGLRLPLTKTYRFIRSVNAQLHECDAVYVKVIDKDKGGPLVMGFGSSGSVAVAKGDFTIKGY